MVKFIGETSGGGVSTGKESTRESHAALPMTDLEMNMDGFFDVDQVVANETNRSGPPHRYSSGADTTSESEDDAPASDPPSSDSSEAISAERPEVTHALALVPLRPARKGCNIKAGKGHGGPAIARVRLLTGSDVPILHRLIGKHPLQTTDILTIEAPKAEMHCQPKKRQLVHRLDNRTKDWTSLNYTPPVPEFQPVILPTRKIGILTQHQRIRGFGLEVNEDGFAFRERKIRGQNLTYKEACRNRKKGDEVHTMFVPAADGGAPTYQRFDATGTFVDPTNVAHSPDIKIDQVEYELAEDYYRLQMTHLSQYQQELELLNARCALDKACFPPESMNISDVPTQKQRNARIKATVAAVERKLRDEHNLAEESDDFADRLYNARRREMHELKEIFEACDKFREIAGKIPFPAAQAHSNHWEDTELLKSCLTKEQEMMLTAARTDPQQCRDAQRAVQLGQWNGRILEPMCCAEQCFILGWSRKDVVQKAPHLLSIVKFHFWTAD